MTATSDEAALFKACLAEPQDSQAVLLLADAIQEFGRERDAVYLRCTADPDNDAHRHALASLVEPVDRDRADFIRACLEFGKTPYPIHHIHTERWRRGPVCAECDGTGRRFGVKPQEPPNCPHCWEGDVGGLNREWPDWNSSSAHDPRVHHIEYVRGCVRVHCRLDEAFRQWHECRSCRWRNTFNHRHGQCPNCKADWHNETCYGPTDWIRAVCRHHPVTEVWVSDRDPEPYRDSNDCWAWYDMRGGSAPGPMSAALSNWISPPIWDRLQGWGIVPLKPHLRYYSSPELARVALARAAALAVRLDLEERP